MFRSGWLCLPFAHLLTLPFLLVPWFKRSAKTSGGYDDGQGRGGCAYLQKSFVSPAVRAYMNGPEWQSVIKYDKLLHQAVNSSLDMTIDDLGRDKFLEQLLRYRTMQRQIHQDCAHKVRMPCDAQGNLRRKNETDCLLGDTGCGFECIDESLRRLGRH
jgi:hypothetical protein